MPVLDNALTGVAGFFTPIMLGLRFGRPIYELASRVTSAIPRSHYVVDMGLDVLRQRPGPSLAVLEGLLLGETAPHREQRRAISQPTLIVGHTRDPVHPFSDSGMLAEELENATLIEANSILEWRLTPSRLDDELAAFLDRVWETSDDCRTRRWPSGGRARIWVAMRARHRGEARQHATGQADREIDDAALDGDQPVLETLEAVVDVVEAPVTSTKRRSDVPVDLVEAPVDFIEAPVDLVEAPVDPLGEMVESFVGPALPHRLHDASLEDNKFRLAAEPK